MSSRYITWMQAPLSSLTKGLFECQSEISVWAKQVGWRLDESLLLFQPAVLLSLSSQLAHPHVLARHVWVHHGG